MKKLLFLCGIISALSCKSQTANVRSSLLWEVKGNGLSQSSYLFGTIHLACDSDMVVTEPLSKALSNSKQMYLELDMDDASTMMQSMMGMMMKDGQSLETLLPKSTYDSVTQKFSSVTGMPAMMINRLKPMLTSAMLYPFLLGCGGQGWDMKLASLAKKDGKEIHGLEAVADQMSVFDSIPYKEQAEMFASMVLNMDSTRKSFKQLLETYRKKDVDAISKMTSADESMKKYESLMLLDRNRNWIPKIEKAMKDMPTFIAVGAGHLGGNDGVIDLLRKKGYTLTPIAY